MRASTEDHLKKLAARLAQMMYPESVDGLEIREKKGALRWVRRDTPPAQRALLKVGIRALCRGNRMAESWLTAIDLNDLGDDQLRDLSEALARAKRADESFLRGAR